MSAKTLEQDANTAELVSLEEKIYRTIELLKSAREAKATAERSASRLREQLEEREEENERLRSELVSLRKDREDVRGRVEKLLKQVDSMVTAEAE